MRVFTKFTLDLETLQPIESTYFEYDGPCDLACGGPSQAEQTAQQQAAAESSALFQNFQTQFAEQQNFVQNFLTPQLISMYQSPTGFGAAALADLDANLVNTVGSQLANTRQQANANFDVNNMKGLPSGVEQAIQANVNSMFGNELAQGKTNIDLANQQYKNQQQMTAFGMLQGIPGMLGASPQVGGLLTGANRNSFDQASTMQQQGNFWGNLGQGLLGGLINSGVGLLSGHLPGMFGGGGTSGADAAALDASVPGVAAGAAAGGGGGIADIMGGIA